MRRAAAIHDGVSRAGFVLAAGILAFISIAYCYEVISRYFFNAPTIWASPLVSYGLLITIFLTLPELARRGLHVSVDLHESWLSLAALRVLQRMTRLAAALVCLIAAWITGAQTWSEYSLGVLTNTFVPIPKWWLFVFIPYGFLSGGIYFLRHALGEQPPASAEAVQ